MVARALLASFPPLMRILTPSAAPPASRPTLNTIAFHMVSHWECQFQYKLEREHSIILLLAWMLQVSSPNLTFLGLNKTMTDAIECISIFLIIVCASMVLLGSLSPLQSHNLLYLFQNFYSFTWLHWVFTAAWAFSQCSEWGCSSRCSVEEASHGGSSCHRARALAT